jgi:hypothetical protein
LVEPECARVITVIWKSCLFRQRRERALWRRSRARRELRGTDGRHLGWSGGGSGESGENVVVVVVIVDIVVGGRKAQVVEVCSRGVCVSVYLE